MIYNLAFLPKKNKILSNQIMLKINLIKIIIKSIKN